MEMRSIICVVQKLINNEKNISGKNECPKLF